MIAIALKTLTSRIGLYVVAALAVAGAVWWWGHSQYQAGYAAHETEMAIAAANAEKERRDDDARLQSLSDYDLCTGYLRARGMPVDACDQLRGLPAQ